MKQTLLLTVTAISLVFSAVVNAESSDDPAGLKKIRKEHQKKAMDRIKPVNDHYKQVLEQKLKSANKFNKIDEAKTIEKELDLLKKDHAFLLLEQVEGVAQFEGTWEVFYEGWQLTRTLIINDEGKVITKDSFVGDGIMRPDWDYSFSIIYDNEHKTYVASTFPSSDETESFEIIGRKRMAIKRLRKKDHKVLQKGAGKLIKKEKDQS